MKTVIEFLTEKLAQRQINEVVISERVNSVLVNELNLVEYCMVFGEASLTVVDEDNALIALTGPHLTELYEVTENGIKPVPTEVKFSPATIERVLSRAPNRATHVSNDLSCYMKDVTEDGVKYYSKTLGWTPSKFVCAGMIKLDDLREQQKKPVDTELATLKCENLKLKNELEELKNKIRGILSY